MSTHSRLAGGRRFDPAGACKSAPYQSGNLFPLRKRRAGYSQLRPDRVGAFLQSQCRLLVGFDQRPDAAMEVTSRYCKEHTFLFAAPHLRRDVSEAVSEDKEERGNGQGELPRSGKRGWSGPCGAFSPLASRPNEVVVMRSGEAGKWMWSFRHKAETERNAPASTLRNAMRPF